jgi:hypothetical protein
MEEGTPPPAYTFPSYTTYTPPHNPVITGTLINDVLASLSPSPEPEIAPMAPIPTPASTVLPVKPTSRRKVGHSKIDSTQAPVHTIFELLAHIIMPDKRVRQGGGKTKHEMQEAIKKGPIDSLFRFGCRNCQMTATQPDYNCNQLDFWLRLGPGVSSRGCGHQESVHHPNQLQPTGTGDNLNTTQTLVIRHWHPLHA